MVTLIGAGPGDAGLLTLKGAKKLKEADVVLFDRLVGRDILSLIPETAEKIDVSKEAGNHSLPQNEINTLLLKKALEGLMVVRLKGGDPFVFGRGGEELEFLAENGIEFEVVPGVSSSVASGAYAGIPVTHRDFSSSLHILTGHLRENGRRNIDYETLAKLNGTLVFMMSVSALREISEGLINAGMKRDMPAALIESATLSSQRKFIGNLETLSDIAEGNNVVSPSVAIIGGVCALSDKLDWFSRKPMLGKRVMVTRARTSESVLSEQLRELGCDVYEAPCIRIVPLIEDNPELEKAVKSITEYSWLVFTSAVGVNLFFEYLINSCIDIRKLHHMKIAAVGSETRKEIEKHGVFVDYVPEKYSGLELANGLLPLIAKNERVLIARAKLGTEEIPDIFTENGIAYDDISIYDTATEICRNDTFSEMLQNGMIDLVTFTSSSTVEGFVNAFKNINPKSVNGLCIGEKTAETADKYGIKAFVSKEATIRSMVEKIKELFTRNDY